MRTRHLLEGGLVIDGTGAAGFAAEAAGRLLADIAADWGVTQQQACRRLQPGGACYFQMHADDVERVIAHPLAMIGSDGLPHDQHPHPRLWGHVPARAVALLPRQETAPARAGDPQDDGAVGAPLQAAPARPAAAGRLCNSGGTGDSTGRTGRLPRGSGRSP